MRLHAFSVLCISLLFTLSASRPLPAQDAPPPLVVNGDFEADANGDGVPDGWTASGTREIVQVLETDTGRDGGRSARLVCTTFVSGSPASHAMVCQVNTVGIKRGKWYRISFWTKSDGITDHVCDMAVRNTQPWASTGLDTTFPAAPDWTHVEKLCHATAEASAEHSRLQFWYQSTGTLWLDDVTITEEGDVKVEYHPQIDVSNVRNPIPNSSFECGTSGWGSYKPGVKTWGAGVFSCLGQSDDSEAFDGKRSLRVHVDRRAPKTFYFDYFEPFEEQVTALVTAHHGWLPVDPGKAYTVSGYVKADQDDVPVIMMAHEGSGREHRHLARVGKAWQRVSFTITPRSSFVWTGIGLDLSQDGAPDAATLWLDAVQFEPGSEPTDYERRATVESAIATGKVGNVFTDPDAGLTLELRACNSSDAAVAIRGELRVRDAFDNLVCTEPVQQRIGAKAAVHARLGPFLRGRRGFFRAEWRPENGDVPLPSSLRCAVIEPYSHADSAFGMNHAYPWAFLLDLARQTGLTWMRDWSVKWHTVEPQESTFDFGVTDRQVDRVLERGLNVLMLFPFASTPWNSTADMALIKKEADGSRYKEERYVIACAANDKAQYQRYIDRSVAHYADRIRAYEIMNEPLYTTYALPQRFGHTLDDYLQHLRLAYNTIKARQPTATVLGGIGMWIGRDLVHRFIESGGLDHCDIMDIHQYPNAIAPEFYEDDIAKTWKLMVDRGQAKPVWLTEFGCYADDDPDRTPSSIGDSAMSKSNWPSERAAAEALVKTAAVYLSYGVEKIFYHAGTCGRINRTGGGGIFFEYGGTPRKMYAALSALATMLGPDWRRAPSPVQLEKLNAYAFNTAEGAVAILWTRSGVRERVLGLPTDVTVLDLMGNRIDARPVTVTTTPVYVMADSVDRLRAAFKQ